MATEAKEHLIIMDSHVHIHNCFSLPYFLNSAYENCTAEIRRLRKNDQFSCVLFLTEMSKDHWFEHLKSNADNRVTSTDNDTSKWSFHHTTENNSLLARSARGGELVLVAGRQILTKENLEVLALATDSTFKDGVSIRETIDVVRERGAIPVIPWGFGKWWGQRGKVLTDILWSERGTDLFLGDTSARPSFLPRPSHFNQAERQGIRILPGSDPLPLSSESWRPCSIGFSVLGSIMESTPAADLKRILRNPDTVLSPYSRPENWRRFIRNQLAIQLMKCR